MNMPRIWKLFFLMVIFLFILTGCAHVRMDISNQKPLSNGENTTLLAGAAKADITPPPGMPKGGYSTWAKYSKGFRTRLYARVLYVKPKVGRSVAIVQCDLLTGSLLTVIFTTPLPLTRRDLIQNTLITCRSKLPMLLFVLIKKDSRQKLPQGRLRYGT